VPVEQNPKRFAVIPYLDDRPDMRSAQAGHSGPPLVIKLYALSDQKRVFHGCRPVDPIARSSKQRSEIRSCLRAAFFARRIVASFGRSGRGGRARPDNQFQCDLPACAVDTRGVGHRRKRGAGRGGREVTTDERGLKRTVKS
jgi:hypothetical protein